MNVFGQLAIPTPADAALAKFRACPWQFFDGVPDRTPDRLQWGDFAITRVMSSGLNERLIDAALKRASSGDAGALLTAIHQDYDLVRAPAENDELYVNIDRLFAVLMGPNFKESRAAKVLSRKRPLCIPMLDTVVVEFLCRVWRIAKDNPKEVPAWLGRFPKRWTTEISPYLRMIREDARRHVDQLKAIRRQLAADPLTGVPSNAPLLRIWEATVFWTLWNGQ